MNIRVLEKGCSKDIKAFRSLPFRLYRQNPFWVPPLPGEIETVMSPGLHPFYTHSEADFIVLEDNHEILGRLAILHNRNYCALHQEKTAFFYYFEAVEDAQVVEELFDFADKMDEYGIDYSLLYGGIVIVKWEAYNTENTALRQLIYESE